MGGFCEKLLPSDRWQWSDVSGLQHRPLDGVALPSPHWAWESDWYVDENFGGEPTEKGVGEFRSHRGPLVGKDPCPPGAVRGAAPDAPTSTLSRCPAWSRFLLGDGCSGSYHCPLPPSPVPSSFLPSPRA